MQKPGFPKIHHYVGFLLHIMWSISFIVTLLVINSLRGKHTYNGLSRQKVMFKNQAIANHWLTCTKFN